MQNGPVGGSMYERREPGPNHVSLRQRMWAELEAFGPIALKADTKGVERGATSAPVRRPTGGETVVAHCNIASGPGAGADASECLATFKSDRPGPHHAAFMLTILAHELTEFAGGWLLDGFPEAAKLISLAQGTAHSLRVNDRPVLGWALRVNGASGIVVEFDDRLLMWLGTTDRTRLPETIYTKDIGRPKMVARVF